MKEGEAPRTAHSAEVGAKGNIGDVALPDRLQEGPAGRATGQDTPDAEGDELGIREVELGHVVVEGLDETEGGVEQDIRNRVDHRPDKYRK